MGYIRRSIEIARQNNDALHANVSFQHTDILSYQPGDDKYDIIVSNPPYITEKEKSSMHQNVLNWEPGQALFVPDSDPLMFYRKIAETGTKLLIDGGSIYFEINQQYGKETSQMLEDLNYRDIRLIKDLYGNDRMITARYERDYR